MLLIPPTNLIAPLVLTPALHLQLEHPFHPSLTIGPLVISHSPTTCPLELISHYILQSFPPDLLPFLTHLINTTLTNGCFLDTLKAWTLLKETKTQPIWCKERPTVYVLFISKALEHVVFSHLSASLTQNKLLKLTASRQATVSGSALALFGCALSFLTYCTYRLTRICTRSLWSHYSVFCPGHPLLSDGAQPSREGISLPKPLHQHSQLCGVCDKDGKESVCDIGWPPTPEDSSCTTSGGYVCSSPRRPPRFWSRSSHSFTTATLAGLRTIRPLKFIHNAASGLVFNPHSTDTLHLPSAPCVGYGWPSKL